MSEYVERLWHRRLPNWEAFDRITFEVVPRYKTSGMSGDEWRTSVAVKFWFKGVEVHEEWYRDMETALMMAPAAWVNNRSPIPDAVLAREEKACDQPGCSSDAVARVSPKRLTSDRGDWLDMSDQHGRYYRAFCKRHIQRGDCSREDADANYEPLDGVGPEVSTNVEESPSAVMVVEVSGEES